MWDEASNVGKDQSWCGSVNHIRESLFHSKCNTEPVKVFSGRKIWCKDNLKASLCMLRRQMAREGSKSRWRIQVSSNGWTQGGDDQDGSKWRGRKNILEAKPGDLADGFNMGLAEREKQRTIPKFWLKQLTIWRCHFLSQREIGKIRFGPWIQKFHLECTNLDVKQICGVLFLFCFFQLPVRHTSVKELLGNACHFVVCSSLYSIFSHSVSWFLEIQ